MKLLISMKKPVFSRLRTFVLVLIPVLFLSAIPLFIGSGLNIPEPIGRYLDGKFPSIITTGEYYVPVFPNITFDSPLSFNEVPGNKIIVGQRDGKMYWFDKSDTTTEKNLTIDLSDKVGVVWDGGMISAELHPNFGTLGYNYFYTYYSTKDTNGNNFPDEFLGLGCNLNDYYGNFLILARYDLDPNTLVANENSEQILIKRRLYNSAHRGGAMQFGDDGFLYITTGEHGTKTKSQDIANNLDGAVLRIDVDQDATKSHAAVKKMPDSFGFSDEITGNGYFIPNDNPFLSPTGQLFEEYYALGKRNPHRMTKDKSTGKMYIGDVGGGLHEEINVLEKGKNYGWPYYEGLYNHGGSSCLSGLLDNMPHEEPLTTFPRAIANVIIGGYVYRGTEVPEMQGRYICADYGVGEEIWSVNIEDGSYEQLGNFESTDIISFGQDTQGELYLLKQGVSNIYKFVSPDAVINNSPKLLSETGAFTDLATLTPRDGLIPYDMIESFWSDGALKQRWMAIPNDGTHNNADEKINFSEDGDWQFPIGSVLVKHFELPIDERNPTITKRLETRFSIKAEDGDFYFLTYKWNDSQTDATLLETSLDESVPITKADGSADTQVWHYPNRGECITCHKSITGGTLGPRTRFLNSNITYAKTGLNANQLVTLSSLGILDQTITDGDTENFLTYKALSDASATLDEKARSYLDNNCAYCHRSDNTGNGANFDLRLFNNLTETGLLTANARESIGIDGEKIIVVGDASKSILYHRINSVTDGIAMPPLAKNKIDEQAVELIKDWINQLEEPADGGTLPNGLTNLAEGVFHIESKISGKVLEVDGASSNDEANVQKSTNDGLDNQTIRIIKQGNGYYLLTFEHSGKVLEVNQNGKTAGTNVHQYTANANEGQLWGFKSEGGGYYQIIGQGSNLFLDVSGGSAADGANIIIWSENSGDNQSWKLVPVESTLSSFDFSNNNPILILNANPVSDMVTIKLKNFNSSSPIEYNIYSITGREVLSRKGGLEEHFILNNLAKGHYIIKASFDGNTLVKRLLIK